MAVYPAKHFITSRPTIERASRAIREELAARLAAREAGLQLHPRARLSWAEANAEVRSAGGHG